MKSSQDNLAGRSLGIIISLLIGISCHAFGQPDEDPPVSPRFTLLTINPSNNNTELRWDPSPSADVAGYIVYSYKNGEAYDIDTILNPLANSYSFLWPWSLIRSESFVVAAVDSSGNFSPLSNDLQTIYAEARIDTCNSRIALHWNKYIETTVSVAGYNIYVSINGENYVLADQIPAHNDEYLLNDFITDAHYCYLIEARLENGLISASNIPCIDTDMQKNPLWINADYATVEGEGEILLSFTVDPESEINLFSLERKSGKEGKFTEISRFQGVENKIIYSDKTADNKVINTYRLSAVNNCNIVTTSSNYASNMVLNVIENGNDLLITWNKYREWLGTAESSRLFMDKGAGFSQIAELVPDDSVYSISIPDIMHDVSGGRLCFYVSATESGNPFGVAGSESVSNIYCYSIEEVITMPNIFSPNGDGINDLFRPVITFPPINYRLTITDRRRKTLFESDDYTESWDGRERGKPVPQDVYLWFLRLTTPSGNNVARTGTLTVIY